MIPLPIANGLYNDRSLPVSHQMCKNWYPAMVGTEGLSQQVLYGTPGLLSAATTGGINKINRGSHTKEGIPYFVNGTSLYSLIKTTPLGVDAFNTEYLGEVGGTGRVSMADNGAQLMIVSGGEGFIYNEASGGWQVGESASSSSWSDVAYDPAQDIYVAVGSSVAATSPDGLVWTTQFPAFSNAWLGVAFGSGQFVAVSFNGTGNRVMTSPDGETWTIRSSAADNEWQSIAYGDGIFVAVSSSGTGNRVMTSPDGVTWTIRTSANDYYWYRVAYGNGKFVALTGPTGTRGIMTSTDGITWAMASGSYSSGVNSYTGISYGNGIFLGVHLGGAISSSDGEQWADVEGEVDTSFYGVAFGDGVFVAFGLAGSDGFDAQRTTRGVDWFGSTTGVGALWTAVGFGGDRFFGVVSSFSIQSFNAGGPLEKISNIDPDFLANGAPLDVRFVDSYFAVTTDEKKWIRSAANNGLAWNALDFGTAEADPDAIQAIEIMNNDVYIFGTETTEQFDNIGGSGFGFQRSEVIFNKGVASTDAVVKTTNGIAFLGGGQDESPSIWSLEGNSIVKLSHPGIDNVINGYSLDDIEACFAMYYSEAGEFFVSFTFPLKTFVYGFASQLWHERESSGLRWRVNSLTTGYARLFAGDAIDGRIGEMGLDIYSEYGEFIEAQVSSPNFSNQGERAFYPKLELTMEAGVGNADTPNPVVVYDYSDNGKTFKGARSRTVGRIGEYDMRTIWRRNGSAPRYRTNRFTFTGMTKRTVIKLEADIEA